MQSCRECRAEGRPAVSTHPGILELSRGIGRDRRIKPLVTPEEGDLTEQQNRGQSGSDFLS